jgi:tRNA A37 threonylcarbamoyladenosine biosynthesis protein TsaE
MANRIIAIGGEPATGKTSLMRTLIKRLTIADNMPLRTFKYGLIQGLYSKQDKLYIIGIYDESLFSGTDKLSMAVQPVFLDLTNALEDSTIIFEGDRLFNQSLFNERKCDIIILQADDITKKLRHKNRQDNQTDKFLKAKKTKIKNIKENNNTKILSNNNDVEREANLSYIMDLINEQNRTP